MTILVYLQSCLPLNDEVSNENMYTTRSICHRRGTRQINTQHQHR